MSTPTRGNEGATSYEYGEAGWQSGTEFDIPAPGRTPGEGPQLRRMTADYERTGATYGDAATGRSGGERADGEGLARFLGWFSIGLGLAEVVAPERLATLIGVRDDDRNVNILRAFGLREIGNGIGLLARPQSATLAWGRVVGDAMDLAFLNAKRFERGSDPSRIAAAAAAVAGVTALDVLCGQRLSRDGDGARARGAGARGLLARRPAQSGWTAQGGVQVRQSLTITRSPEEVYAFWRDFRNLPQFMSHLEAVQVIDDRRSRWTARAPAGRTVEWEAEIVEDRPGELIAWRSLQGADVPNSGVVRFARAPGDRGTEIVVELQYQPPAGALGAAIAKLFGEEPNEQIKGDLRRFKQVIETGEVVHSDASIYRGPHPARPSERPFDRTSNSLR
jgi:uncharacterized membrane protein